MTKGLVTLYEHYEETTKSGGQKLRAKKILALVLVMIMLIPYGVVNANGLLNGTIFGIRLTDGTGQALPSVVNLNTMQYYTTTLRLSDTAGNPYPAQNPTYFIVGGDTANWYTNGNQLVIMGSAPSGTITVRVEDTAGLSYYVENQINITAKVVSVDKSVLETKIEQAVTLVTTSVEGTEPGQYSASDRQTLWSAVQLAGIIYEGTGYDQARVDAEVVALQTAITAFENSVIPAPMTVSVTFVPWLGTRTVEAVQIKLNGVVIGSTNGMGELVANVTPGNYTLEASRVGMNTYTEDIVIGEGTVTVEFNVTVPRSWDKLIGLTPVAGGLNEVFHEGTLNYTMTVANSVETVTFHAITKDGATVRMNGDAPGNPINLVEGENTIEIEVTAENATNKTTYTVIVTRQTETAIPTIKYITGIISTRLSGNILIPMPETVVNLNAARLEVPFTKYTLQVTSRGASGLLDILKNIPAQNPLALTEVTTESQISLYPISSNSILLVGFYNDQNQLVGYSTDPQLRSYNNLSLVQTSLPINPVFSSDVTSYTVDVPYETAQFILNAGTAQGATVTINGETRESIVLPLVVGENTIEIVVTAEDGTAKTYTVVVTRQASQSQQYDADFTIYWGAASPLESASIAINGQTLITDANGKASIQLADGTYAFTVSKADWTTQEGSVVISGGSVSVVRTLLSSVSTAPQSYPVEFTVNNSLAGAIQGAIVSVTVNNQLSTSYTSGFMLSISVVNLPITGTTNQDGKTGFLLPNGTHNYTVSKTGYNTVAGTITVNGAPAGTTVVLSEAITTTPTTPTTGGGGGGGSAAKAPVQTPVIQPTTKITDGLSTVETGQGTVKAANAEITKIMGAGKPVILESAIATLDFGAKSLAVEEVKTGIGAYLELGALVTEKKVTEEVLTGSKLSETGLVAIGGKVLDLVAQLNYTDGTSKKIKSFAEPVKVTINLKEIGLTGATENMTAVRFVPQADGSYKTIKLGGTYNADTDTFSFYTDSFSLYSIVKADKIRKIKLTVDKHAYSVDETNLVTDVTPVIEEDRTLVPIRVVAEALGAEVDWDQDTRVVTIALDGNVLTLTIDQLIEDMDVPAKLLNNRTMVPIRYVSEKLGAYVMWFAAEQRVDIII